jgi:hypothetical protein
MAEEKQEWTAGHEAFGPLSMPDNLPRTLGVGMVGRLYRLEWFALVAGKSIIEPFDGRLFASVSEARRACRDAKSALTARARGQ